VVQGWELTLFGTQPSRTFAGAMPMQWLSELLHAGYLAYYVAIFAPPLLLYVRGERRAFGQTVLTLTVIYSLSWVLFVLMPVEGPRYLWGAPTGVPDGLMRRLAVQVLAAGSSRGAAFPSSHMAVMVGQTLMAFRWQPRVGWVLAVVSVLVGFGAVYGGFHYATDMLAGAILGSLCATAVLRSARAEEGRRR
jgi:membrane-associated phospholipid phosphatase